MRHIVAIIIITLVTLCVTSPMIAETTEKFGWIEMTEELVPFPTDPPALSFESHSPEGFIWTPTDEIPPEFTEAGVFSSLRQIYTGMGSEGLEGLVIRVYVATIVPERVLLGTGYAQLLAARWGRMNFGILAHSRDFGEVLGGDDSSGVRRINRISVVRRGTSILILRSDFAAEDFPRWADEIAGFHGSLRFLDTFAEDPIAAKFHRASLPLPGAADFAFLMPGTWAEHARQDHKDPRMTVSLWSDQDDPNGNNGAMILAVAPPDGVPGRQLAPPKEQEMNNLAGRLAEVALGGLLPEQSYDLTPKNKASFAEFDAITLAQGIYYFAAAQPGQEPTLRVNVLISMGPNGAVLGAVGLSPAGRDLYLLGSAYHGEFVTHLHMAAQARHWGTQAVR